MKKIYIAGSLLILSMISLFFIKPDKTLEEKSLFKESNFLSKPLLVENEASINISGGVFLSERTPPFLIEGETFASISAYQKEKEIKVYLVEEGDTIASIAEEFGITTTTILEANNLSTKSVIQPGKKLTILPVTGLIHMVGPGDTIGGIALSYKVDKREVTDINGIEDNKIFIGDMLIVPGGTKPKRLYNVVQVSLPGNYFICPIPAPCRITQGKHFYNAIDFSNGSCGEPVFAAAGGVIQRAGYDNTGGNYVRIEHSNGVITYYGHLSKRTVTPGQRVYQGQIIGYIGHSGYTIPAGPAGCHLHFDVRFAANPFSIYGAGTQLGQ